MASLDRTFSALSHPIRRAVLARLRRGESPVKDIAAALKISGPALTRHLHVLEDAGLITRGRDAQRRPCRLSVRPIRELDVWMDSYRQFWEESAGRLAEHLKAVQSRNQKETKR